MSEAAAVLVHHLIARINRRLVLVTIASLVGVIVFAACATSPDPSATVSFNSSAPASTSSAAGSNSAAPSPVATESNPPGDIPDTQVFVAYTSPDGFSVRVPEGWARSSVPGGVSYTDKLNTVTVTGTPVPSAPTAASARSTDVPELARTTAKFQLTSVTTLTRPAGPAVLVRYQCDSAVDPVTGKVVRDAVERYLFWHNGELVALTLSGPVGADNVDPWKTVTSSLRWTR